MDKSIYNKIRTTLYNTILKFNTKSSPISIVNLKQKTDSKLEVRIKAFKRNAGDHHQKQLLDELCCRIGV